MQWLGDLETSRVASVPALTSPTTEPTTREPLCPPGAQVPTWQSVERTGQQTLDKRPGFRSRLYLCDGRRATRPPVPRPSPYPLRITRGPASPALRTGCVGAREVPPGGFPVASAHRCRTEGYHAPEAFTHGAFQSTGHLWRLGPRPRTDIPSRLSPFTVRQQHAGVTGQDQA